MTGSILIREPKVANQEHVAYNNTKRLIWSIGPQILQFETAGSATPYPHSPSQRLMPRCPILKPLEKPTCLQARGSSRRRRFSHFKLKIRHPARIIPARKPLKQRVLKNDHVFPEQWPRLRFRFQLLIVQHVAPVPEAVAILSDEVTLLFSVLCHLVDEVNKHGSWWPSRVVGDSLYL